MSPPHRGGEAQCLFSAVMSASDDRRGQLGEIRQQHGVHLGVYFRPREHVHPLLLGHNDVAVGDGDAEGGEVVQVGLLVLPTSVKITPHLEEHPAAWEVLQELC